MENKTVEKEDCERTHDKLEVYIDGKFKAFKELVDEKLKSISRFNIIHLIGYASIIIGLLAIFFKK